MPPRRATASLAAESVARRPPAPEPWREPAAWKPFGQEQRPTTAPPQHTRGFAWRHVSTRASGRVVTNMETLLRDVRYAWRSLARMRGLATAAIATLALGIGATTTMFGVVYATFLREPPFVDADRLAILFNTTSSAASRTFRLRWSRPQIALLEHGVSSFESLGYYSPALVAISGRGDPEHADSEVASSQYFAALRVTPIAGRVFTTADDAIASESDVTLISAGLWRRRFA